MPGQNEFYRSVIKLVEYRQDLSARIAEYDLDLLFLQALYKYLRAIHLHKLNFKDSAFGSR